MATRTSISIAPGTGPAPNQPQSLEFGVDTKHPEWDRLKPDWDLMRDANGGEIDVKNKGYTYLSMPLGFTKQPDKGVAVYNAYRQRAQFPEILSPTIIGMAGIIHRMEAKIDLPASMEPLWEHSTRDGLSLEALHRKLTFELLTTGRQSLLVDADPKENGGSEIPLVACYNAESLINWSEDRDFFVLDETALRRVGYGWIDTPQWRVLELQNGVYTQRVVQGDNHAEGETFAPERRGGQTLKEIPFVVINAKSLDVPTDVVPLVGVSRASLAIYQLTADYRFQLFMTGQETLFVYNMDEPDIIGAGVIVATGNVSKENHEPKAEYVGPKGTGIEAHRKAIEDEYEKAAKAGAKLFEKAGSTQESGEAKRLRYAAETATLTTIARSSAQGLEKSLRHIAIMMGEDPTKVIVHPNLNLLDSKLGAGDVLSLVESWQKRGISYDTLYENLQRGEVGNVDRTKEEEVALITGDVILKMQDDLEKSLKDPALRAV